MIPTKVEPKPFWWLNPTNLIVYFVIPIYGAVFILGNSLVTLRGATFFSAEYFGLGLVLLLLIALGSSIGVRFGSPRAHGFPIVHKGYLDFLATLTFVAYAIWFRVFLESPNLIISVLTGALGQTGLRTLVDTIPGITTLSQLGIVYVVIYGHQRWIVGVDSYKRRHTVYLWVIIGLALLRVVAWSERLSAIEVLLPLLMCWIVTRRLRKPLRRIARLGPFLAIVALLVFFAVTEYLRTWLDFYQYQSTPFIEFVGTRIVSYYYTALNNGAGLLTVLEWPSMQFTYVLNWLYEFPLLGAAVSTSFFEGRSATEAFLPKFADPEFNNPSGIFTIIYDLGGAAAAVYFTVLGLMSGIAFRSFSSGQGSAGLFYPIIFVAILEVTRIPYLALGRTFPIVFFLAIAVLISRPQNGRISSGLQEAQSSR